MGNDIPNRYTRLTDDETQWLEEARAPEPMVKRHTCGNCKTPFGRSAVPCRNDPMTKVD